MKKKFLQNERGILLALLSFLCVISIKAQTWTAPTLTGSTLTTGTTYYVYNVGSNGYLVAGANWGTQSAVSPLSRASASISVVKYTAINSGATWTFQYNLAGVDVANWFLCPTITTNGYVETNDYDWAGRLPNRPWNVALTDAANNIYSLQVPATYGGYNATQYLGTEVATESTNKGIANTVKYNRAGGNSYTQWKFASQADLDLYNARVLLDKYMTFGKNKGLDVTSYITTYNAGVTADITAASATLLTALGRTDVTSKITNPSFESSLTGWTNSGFNTQTNVPDQGWTKDLATYVEKWTGGNGNLPASTITQTVSGLTSGLYELVVSGHGVQQGGSNPLHTGAFITAGSQKTEVAAGQDYSVSNIVVAGTTLTVGYSLVAPVACNWAGFDNFRLYYYGPLAIPVLSTSKTSLTFNGAENNVSDILTVTGANLSNVITISAPAGITVNPTSLPSNSLNASVTVTFDNLTTMSGNITFTSGSTVTNVAVSGTQGAVCFTPLYSSGNLIVDPSCNYYLADGWGNKSINTDPAYVYCGTSSGKITSNGSFDRKLTGVMQPNTKYRVKAMVYKLGTSANKVGVGVYGYNSALSDIYNEVTPTDSWQVVDFTFTSGATLKADQGVYCNFGDGFIDNWEMYDVTAIVTENINHLASQNQTVYIQENKIVADFNLSESSNVEFFVYNVQGMLISKLNGNFNEGSNHAVISSNIPSGVYLVKIARNGKSITEKVIK